MTPSGTKLLNIDIGEFEVPLVAHTIFTLDKVFEFFVAHRGAFLKRDLLFANKRAGRNIKGDVARFVPRRRHEEGQTTTSVGNALETEIPNSQLSNCLFHKGLQAA